MSNLRSSGHLPLKTSMSNKWKAQAPTSEMLERQTRALEESLNKLKIAMHPDKTKTAADPNAPIWDKGKTGPLSQYANHVLRDEPRRVFDANKPTRIRVLGDEPLATVVRPSLVASLFSSKPTVPSTVVRCGQCEKDEAKMKCLECAESYCAACFAHFHLRGALQRHRCVPLSDSRPATPKKKRPTVGADVIFKELRFAQSKDEIFRKSTVAAETTADMEDYDQFDEDDEYGGGELLHGNYDEKNSAASFQQALLQWRKGDGQKKGKPSKANNKKRSTHEAQVDTVYDSNGKVNQIPMPRIEFHSSNLTYGEKLLVKKYRRANQMNQEFFQRPTPVDQRSAQTSARDMPVNRSIPSKLNLRDTNIEIEPLYDEQFTDRTQDSQRTITAEENNQNNNFELDDEDEELLRLKNQPRTKSRASAKLSSRPNSSAKRKDSVSSRPGSVAMFQHPLPSLLMTKPGDELKAIVDNQPNSSRPSSAALKKPGRVDSRLPTMWNRNWKPDQSVADGVDMKGIRIDQQSLVQFDAVLDDLLDETKIELASRAENGLPVKPPSTVDPSPAISPLKSARKDKEKPTGSITPTPGRRSLFTFADSPSSIDTAEGGFFTDVNPKKVRASPTPPSVIERSASNEWKPSASNRSARSSAEQRPAVPTLNSLRKSMIENFSPAPPKRSITLEETRQQLEEHSRPSSSLSSGSLPVSIISSQPDNITRPSIERHPKVAHGPITNPTPKKFRVEFPKKSSPPAVPPMVVEGKKVTSARLSARDSDDHTQQSINSSRIKISSGAPRVSQNLMKTSSTTSMTSITRDENLLRDDSLTINDTAVTKKNSARRSAQFDREPSKARKIEFTVKDGAKWQQGSTELSSSKALSSSVAHRSSKVLTSRPSTPSNPTNSKLANQFSNYDNDDGRSSRACQDVEDEECFNQLRVELTSELGTTSPGWNASLSEHVLKNLRTTDIPLSEKDIQDNLNMLETKLRESELLQRSQTDDDFSVHEEIRNL